MLEIRESRAPKNGSPLHWVLLTTLPVETLEQALHVIEIYKCRWLVEEYHKALKTGTRIEHSQLSTQMRIDALLGICAVLAVRLLALKNARASDEAFVAQAGEEVFLKILEAKKLKPAEGWSRRGFIRAVARLGGFLGRKGDGEPGWQSIWHGMFRLIIMAQGYTLAQEFQESG